MVWYRPFQRNYEDRASQMAFAKDSGLFFSSPKTEIQHTTTYRSKVNHAKAGVAWALTILGVGSFLYLLTSCTNPALEEKMKPPIQEPSKLELVLK